MTPTFSIVIPVYNVAPYLRECLDSVLSQTYTNWEAICVDDGSTDDSGKILDEYVEKDKRFIVIHKNNEGVSIARNVAISRASGGYVTFLDSDDVYVTDWLQQAEQLVRDSAADLVRMQFTRLANGAKSYGSIPTENKSICVPKAELSYWGWNVLMHDGYSFLLFIKRSVLNAHHDVVFPQGMRIEEDNIFCLRLLKYLNSVCQGSYAGYMYRQNPTSVIHRLLSIEFCTRFYDECLALWQEWNALDLAASERQMIREQIAYGVNVDLNWFYVDHGRPFFKAARQQASGVSKLHDAGALSFSKYTLMQRIRIHLLLMTSSYIGFHLDDVYGFFECRVKKFISRKSVSK